MNQKHVTHWQKKKSMFLLCPETFQETKYKGIELVDLSEEISKRPNIQVVA